MVLKVIISCVVTLQHGNNPLGQIKTCSSLQPPVMRFLSKLFSSDLTSYNSDPFNLIIIGGRQGGLQVEHNFLSRYQNISDFLDTTGL